MGPQGALETMILLCEGVDTLRPNMMNDIPLGVQVGGLLQILRDIQEGGILLAHHEVPEDGILLAHHDDPGIANLQDMMPDMNLELQGDTTLSVHHEAGKGGITPRPAVLGEMFLLLIKDHRLLEIEEKILEVLLIVGLQFQEGKADIRIHGMRTTKLH